MSNITCRFKGQLFCFVVVRYPCSTITEKGRFVVVVDMIGGNCGNVANFVAIGWFVGIVLMIILSSSFMLGNLILLIGDALMKDGPASDIDDKPLLFL